MRAVQASTSSRREAATAEDADCATAFQTIALDSVAAIKAYHGSACAGDAEAVHQIRVAITRLRAAVAFFAPIVVDAEWLGLKKEIAWLNGPLGDARDSDVVMEYARRKRYRAWAQRMVGEHLDQRQKQDHRRLVRCLRSARTQRLVAAMTGWIRHGAWIERNRRRGPAEPLQTYCARQLGHWHQRLVRKGRSLKTLSASRRHKLRIRAKRFRYMLEALKEIEGLWGKGEWRHRHRSAKQMQQALGDLRDLKRFADLGDRSPQARHAKGHKRRPPNYRARREKLLNAAIAAHRDLKHAGAC
jgi:CHAD domain-containing protein